MIQAENPLSSDKLQKTITSAAGLAQRLTCWLTGLVNQHTSSANAMTTLQEYS